MMGTLKDGSAKVEAGYNERDGAYGKAYIEWEFGSNKEGSKNTSEETSKGLGEVNSTDKDQDRD